MFEPKSFTSFFNHEYYKTDLGHKKFVVSEMSRPFRIEKQPILFDQDDIEFLEQFPRRYWVQAMYSRYHDDLLEALEDRHNRRRPLMEEKFKEVYPEIYDRWLRQDKDPKIAKQRAQRQAQLIAEKYAALHDNGGVSYPEEKTYKFRKQGKNNFEYIRAKPFMQRFVHKIEKEYGADDGFDLEHPRRSRKDDVHSATRGMNLPKYHTIKERLSDWMNYVGHHMLGDLPQHGEWSPDDSEGIGQGQVRDTYTVDRIRTRLSQGLEKKFDDMLRRTDDMNIDREWQKYFPEEPQEPNTIRGQNNLRLRLARAMAWDEIRHRVERGQLRTPPSPHHPQGQILQLTKDGKNIQLPQLYLPQKRTKIKKVDPATGQVSEEEARVPQMLPGKFMVHLPEEERDTIPHDERAGKHWNHETNSWEREYTEVPSINNKAAGKQGSGQIIAGGLNPNHNTVVRNPMDPGDPQFRNRYESLLQEMEPGNVDDEFAWSPDPHGEYYKDIVDSINDSIFARVGGMTNNEVAVLSAMKSDLHKAALSHLIELLGHNEIANKRFRKERVKTIVSNLAQQDWNSGTRRTRRTHGNDDDQSVRMTDFLSGRLQKAKAEGDRKRASEECRIPQGGRPLATGICQFPYDLNQLWEMLADADKDAAMADQATMAQNSSEHIELDALSDKKDALLQAHFALVATHIDVLVAGGMDETEAARTAETNATNDLTQIAKGIKTARGIVQRVKKRMEELLANVEKPSPKATDRRQGDAAWKRFEDWLTQNPSRAQEPDTVRAMNDLVKKYPWKQPEYVALQQKFGKQKNVSLGDPSITAMKQTLQTQGIGLSSLLDSGEYEKIAFRPDFLRLRQAGKISDRMIQGMISRLQSRMKKTSQDTMAIQRLQQLLKG